MSVNAIVRLVAELISGKYITKTSDTKKLCVAICGIALMAICYFCLAFSHTLYSLFIFYPLTAAGFGISVPAKNVLFATHLDKSKASTEWATYDAITLMAMAATAAIGGSIAQQYGFSVLFILASVITFLGIFPYISYILQN